MMQPSLKFDNHQNLLEVSEFIDFLQMRCDNTWWQLWTHFAEGLEIAESGRLPGSPGTWRNPMVTISRGDVVGSYTVIAPSTMKIRLLFCHPTCSFRQVLGLTKDSVVLCRQIRLIDKRRIIKVLGHLDDPCLEQVAKVFRTILGLCEDGSSLDGP